MTATVLPAHQADALDDRFLWEYLGHHGHTFTLSHRKTAYYRMMQRRDIIIVTPKGIEECLTESP